MQVKSLIKVESQKMEYRAKKDLQGGERERGERQK